MSLTPEAIDNLTQAPVTERARCDARLRLNQIFLLAKPEIEAIASGHEPEDYNSLIYTLEAEMINNGLAWLEEVGDHTRLCVDDKIRDWWVAALKVQSPGFKNTENREWWYVRGLLGSKALATLTLKLMGTTGDTHDKQRSQTQTTPKPARLNEGTFMEWEQRCEQRKQCPSHKVPFKKRAQAQGEAARQEQNYYRCRDCGQYHLTTQGDGVGIELKPAAKY